MYIFDSPLYNCTVHVVTGSGHAPAADTAAPSAAQITDNHRSPAVTENAMRPATPLGITKKLPSSRLWSAGTFPTATSVSNSPERS
jgi:hypothetical protein